MGKIFNYILIGVMFISLITFLISLLGLSTFFIEIGSSIFVGVFLFLYLLELD